MVEHLAKEKEEEGVFGRYSNWGSEIAKKSNKKR